SRLEKTGDSIRPLQIGYCLIFSFADEWNTDFLASGGMSVMPQMRHRMRRLPVLFVFSSLTASALAPALSADPSVVPAHPEHTQPPSHWTVGEMLQTGAKLFGRGLRSISPPGYPEVEAKGTSSSAARKEAIAALPVEHLFSENRQKVEALV